jgi:hypothetical protein
MGGRVQCVLLYDVEESEWGGGGAVFDFAREWEMKNVS